SRRKLSHSPMFVPLFVFFYFFFFFFQAEDGIRDFHVTGVQTCALPIFRSPARGPRGRADDADRARRGGAARPTAPMGRRVARRRSEERRVGKECRSRGSPYH